MKAVTALSLVCAAGFTSMHGVTVEHREARHQRRREQRHLGAQLVFELARLEEMQRESRALVFEQQPGMPRDQPFEPVAHVRELLDRARRHVQCAARIAPLAAVQARERQIRAPNSRSRFAMVRPLTSATAPRAAGPQPLQQRHAARHPRPRRPDESASSSSVPSTSRNRHQ